MLATLSRPTDGTVTLAGIDVKEEPERVREAIGLISHNPMLYPTSPPRRTCFCMRSSTVWPIRRRA